MIDLQLFRIRIGYYNRRKCKVRNCKINANSQNTQYITYLISIFFLLIYVTYSFSLTMAKICNHRHHFVYSSSNINLTTIRESHFYNYLEIGLPHRVAALGLFTSYVFFGIRSRKRIFRGNLNIFLSINLFVVSSIRLILLVACNPSIINPGPWQPKVLYQNVQGLIPFSELSEQHPKLNTEKVLELQS